MEHKTKFELDANPYGYGAKKIDAPSGTRHLIGIAGNDSGDFEPGREYGEYDLNFNPSVNVQFKNKGNKSGLNLVCEYAVIIIKFRGERHSFPRRIIKEC
jgi:hypothetical protein